MSDYAGDNCFQVNNIGDFLDAWLSSDFLVGQEKLVFNNYYKSYKKLFAMYIKYHYSQQIMEMMDIISQIGRARILDVGCGCGTESLWMALNGADVIGIDIREERLRVAEARKNVLEQLTGKHTACKFIQTSMLDLDDLLKYDAIWMEQAFHHLEPRDEVVDKIARLLKIGGYVVISEANAWNPLIQANLLRTRGIGTLKLYKDSKGNSLLYGDERILTPYSLCKSLKRKTIIKQSLRYYRIFPNKRL